IAEDLGLGRSGLRRNGDVLNVAERRHGILRRLRGYVVFDAGPRVEPETGLRLKTAAQRDEHAPRNVALGEAALDRLGAVDPEMQFGLIENLLDAEVGGAGHFL